MAVHYNAFISYRHHPQDIKIAQEIHRRLERFHIPGALRKKTGRIDRLFRDKEELPITSNLTQTITQALEHSDYLIVICSEHTRQSSWVQREIDTFLQTHDRSRVLTVLVSGEPQDTIPLSLLQEETVDPVTGETKIKSVEPLSCDWRLPKKQAVREELPRLAAALLNCGYDELRQRQKQYKNRRRFAALTAGLAVSLGLTGYFLYNSMMLQQAHEQTQMHLHQALTNQAQYLAATSGDRLEEGDRLAAIALAMAALPGENNDRPYVPEAEYALSKALGCYESEKSLKASGAYSAAAQIKDFVVTQDRSTIYILDELGAVTAWDVATFQKLGNFSWGKLAPEELNVTQNGDLLVTRYGQLLCLDKTAGYKWYLNDCEDVAFLENGDLLCLMYDKSVRQYDPNTGEPIGQPLPFHIEGYDPLVFGQENYSNSRYVTLHQGYTSGTLYLLDTETATSTKILTSEHTIHATKLHGDRLFTMVSDGSGLLNEEIDGVITTEPARNVISCFALDGTLLWEQELVTCSVLKPATLELLEDQFLLCQIGNKLQCMDPATGEVTGYSETTGCPLTIKYENGYVQGVQADGKVFTYHPQGNSYTAYAYLPSDLHSAQDMDGYFVSCTKSHQVAAYWRVADESYIPYEGEKLLVIHTKAVCGELLALTDYRSVILYNMEQKKQLWKIEGDFEILGFSPDGTSLYVFDRGSSLTQESLRLIQIDTATGQWQERHLPSQIDKQQVSSLRNAVLKQNTLYFLLSDAYTPGVGVWNLETGEVKTIYASQEVQTQMVSMWRFLQVDTMAAWLWDGLSGVYYADLTEGTIQKKTENPLPPVMGESVNVSAIAWASQLWIYSAENGEVTTSLGDCRALALHIYQDQVLALCDDGYLSRFDLAGTLLGRTGLSLEKDFLVELSGQEWLLPRTNQMLLAWYETPDGELVLGAGNMGNVIDTQRWVLKAEIPNFVTYHPQSDTFVCENMGKMFAYHRLTTQQLRQKAEQTLGSFALTEEQKKIYGIQ